MHKVKIFLYPIGILFFMLISSGYLVIVCEQSIRYSLSLEGTSYAVLPFIPEFLSPEYKVCVYDRRGYGWSETYEHDNVNMLQDEPQWSKTNVQFFRQLVDVAQINRPFYLAGHSYGGHHLIYTALEYPELLKGLILLDSSRFSAVDIVEEMLPVVVNFQPTGLMSVAIERKLFDYEKAFSDFIRLSEMPDHLRNAFLAVMMSGTNFLGYMRENENIGYSTDQVSKALRDRVIDIPALVVDAGASEWFPASNFPRYDRSVDYFSVSGATHESLVFSKYYGNITATHMRNFIKRVQNGYYN